MNAVAQAGRTTRRSATRAAAGPLIVFLLVFATAFVFGVWIAARGYRWPDSMSRASSALSVVYSADAKLANIGFVWPPLPTLLDVLGALFYPIWPGVVASGVSTVLTTALCAGATAALLLLTARRLGLSDRLGWTFALVVAANPMLFLYASNGMPEGVALPFLTGAVCCLTLFWHTAKRMWIAAAGVALAFGVLTLYQGVAYGAGVLAALVAGILWSSESRASTPQGRPRAIEGLGLLLIVPPVFVGLLWIGASAVIMGNPLEFVSGDYGYKSFQAFAQTSAYGGPPIVYGDFVGALALVGERIYPFLIPLAFVLLARLVDGRLWRINSLSLLLLGLSVPLGMVVPMAVLGSSMGFLRYLIFPLFVAAGWGLYEIALSRRRRSTVALILAGWVVAFPVELRMMSDPLLGREEVDSVKAVMHGLHRDDPVMRSSVAKYLEAHVLPNGRNVLVDAARGGSEIASQIRPEHTRQLILTYDRRFDPALARPGSYNVGYFLMPDPVLAPQAAIGRIYPRLWSGRQRGVRLVKTLPTLLEDWRIYAVLPGFRGAAGTTGGGG